MLNGIGRGQGRATSLLIIMGFLGCLILGYALFFAWRASPVPSHVAAPATVALNGRTMGALYGVRFILQPNDAIDSAQVQRAIDEVLREIDDELSTWKADSRLSRFNQSRDGNWFEVPDWTVELIEQSTQWSRLSGGKFDITVAPLINLWGFGVAGPIQQAPTTAQIADALAHVGISKLEWRLEPPAVRKLDPHVAIDLSSIAAGAAADRIADRLRQLGIRDYYVDVAGEIVVGGYNALGSPWNIGIAEPDMLARGTIARLQLSDRGIATSGNYRNLAVIGDTVYGHTLDARTGKPVQTDVVSATVIADRCSTADGLATMLMTLDAARGLELAESQGWAVLLAVRQPNGSLELRGSSNMKPYWSAKH